MKPDPIIAVNDVEKSSEWYQKIFGFKSKHGGKEFDVLVDDTGDVMLCLHIWEADNHPTMKDRSIVAGNGLILYFRTERMNDIRENLCKAGIEPDEDIHLNPNSRRNEFSVRDPDGYYLTVSDFHLYEG